MPTFRAFVAIEMPEHARRLLLETLGALRSRDTSGAVRWVAPDGIHITLNFLGELDEQHVPAVSQALTTAVTTVPRFPLSFGDTGTFRDRRGRGAGVVWAGIKEGADTLATLQDAVATELEEAGFARERRAFSPHVTLGRARAGRAIPRGLTAGVVAPETEFTVTGVSLMESRLSRGPAQYTRRYLASLKAP